MNRSGLRNNRLKFIETSGGSPIVLKESMIEYTGRYIIFKWKQQNRKMSTCNRLDLDSLGSRLDDYAQNLTSRALHWRKLRFKLCSTTLLWALATSNANWHFRPLDGLGIVNHKDTSFQYSVQSYLFNTTLDNTTTSILWHKFRKLNFLVQIYLYTTTMTMLIPHS